MSGSIACYIRRHHLGLIALFVALTGTAYAAIGKNEVTSRSIKKGAVKSSDIRNSGVRSIDVGDGQISAADLGEASVGAGQIADGAVGRGEIEDGAVGGGEVADESLGSADIADDSLTAQDIDESTLGDATRGRSAAIPGEACNPGLGTIPTCASVSLTLPRPGPVLVIADGEGFPNASVPVVGTCTLNADGTPISPGANNIVMDSAGASDHFSVVGVSAVLPAGPHTLTMNCAEGDPDFTVRHTHIAAISLGAG